MSDRSPGDGSTGDGSTGAAAEHRQAAHEPGRDPAVWSQFPPHVLREYALVADGHRGALIGPRGDVAWLCAPRWDSPAVLSSLVAGDDVYAITPADACVWGGQYEPGSLIWHNRWTTTRTAIECREALAYPGDPHVVVLLRQVSAVQHDAVVDVVLDLRAEFGRRPMSQLHRDDDGTWYATTGDLRIRWRGVPEAEPDDSGRLRARVTVPAGQRRDVVLEISDRPLPAAEDADALWQRTERAWGERVPELVGTLAPRDARHAYAVLQGLTSPGGGMVAAATLGLPERARQHNSYDYRYVWLRDQAYAGLASAAVGQEDLLTSAVRFASARLLEHDGDVAPAYRVDGTDLPHESTLDQPGYPGGSNLVGNWVRGQTQLDAYGELLQLFAVARDLGVLDDDGRRALDLAVRHVERRWQQPDAGIWELDNRWWTHSRLACLAGLRTLAGDRPDATSDGWRRLADAIEAETTRRCLADDGTWRRAADVPGADGALLLPPVRGALPADDPRTRATLAATERDLAQDGYLYRFAPHDDRLGTHQGAFLLCGFAMALAQWHQGEQVAAVRWFERNRAACGPPGLYAEEYDVEQRQLRGNLPQAFVHALLLETSARLATDPTGRAAP